jgi:hypothetical protein
MPTSSQPREIDGKGKTIRELLAGRKYSIDYYQREYKWQTKQVTELIDDLVATFLGSYEDGHDRASVADYQHYFLGSVIVSDREGRKLIVDGQQRLTSLTLLLIFLQHQLPDSDQKAQVAELIFSQKFGQRSFNMDIPEREACMEALYTGVDFVQNEVSESVANVLARYSDIAEHFPHDLQGDALPYFVDWLIESVHLVEITAYSDEDAYTIFETMNDRGLSLSPADMLKGYLLANIGDALSRRQSETTWKSRMQALQDLGKDEDADGLKAWLRSQYADSIRDRKRGAAPEDFDLIGTEFHRWVRDHETRLGLQGSDSFARLIDRDFVFYSQWYEQLRGAATSLTPGFEAVYYNAEHNFTLQYPVLLAPLRIDDSDEELQHKVRITAAFLDVLIYRRIWNWRAIDYSTMQYAMFLVMREIRGKDSLELAALLRQRLDSESETFAANDGFRLHGMNARLIHRLLARMTDYVETQAGMPSHYTDYAKRGGKDGFEIEHVWADHFDRHTDEFDHPSDFGEYRNRIGDLVLLPKSFNASYGDLSYEEKLVHYNGQNLLARSLHEGAYDHNPGFRRFLETSGLPFKPHDHFRSADLDSRQELYGLLAERIWTPTRVTDEVATAQTI